MSISPGQHRAVNGSFVSKLSSTGWKACSSGTAKMKRQRKNNNRVIDFAFLAAFLKSLLKLAVITISLLLCQAPEGINRVESLSNTTERNTGNGIFSMGILGSSEDLPLLSTSLMIIGLHLTPAFLNTSYVTWSGGCLAAAALNKLESENSFLLAASAVGVEALSPIGEQPVLVMKKMDSTLYMPDVTMTEKHIPKAITGPTQELLPSVSAAWLSSYEFFVGLREGGYLDSRPGLNQVKGGKFGHTEYDDICSCLKERVNLVLCSHTLQKWVVVGMCWGQSRWMLGQGWPGIVGLTECVALDSWPVLCQVNSSKDYLSTTASSSTTLSDQLAKELVKQHNTSKYEDMIQLRKELSIYAMKEEVVQLVRNNQVVMLTEDIGCGKTTQVPQFLLEDSLARGMGSTTRIVVTQPRRTSAIMLAELMARERGEECGEKYSTAGIQIRLESRLPRVFGSILYCTTGLGQVNGSKERHVEFIAFDRAGGRVLISHTFLEGVVVVRSSDSSGLVVLGTELLVVMGNSDYIELGVLRTDLVFKVCFKDV